MALLWMPLSGGAVESSKKENKAMKVLLKTSEGDVVILLSELTPGHRDNFVKNVEAGAYDGVLFHRVIKDFMVQTGDPTSKTATRFPVSLCSLNCSTSVALLRLPARAMLSIRKRNRLARSSTLSRERCIMNRSLWRWKSRCRTSKSNRCFKRWQRSIARK